MPSSWQAIAVGIWSRLSSCVTDFADVVLAFVGDEHARFDAVGLAARHETIRTSLHAEVERHFAVGANVGDVTVAERHKMACGKLGSLLVVDAHGPR